MRLVVIIGNSRKNWATTVTGGDNDDDDSEEETETEIGD